MLALCVRRREQLRERRSGVHRSRVRRVNLIASQIDGMILRQQFRYYLWHAQWQLDIIHGTSVV